MNSLHWRTGVENNGSIYISVRKSVNGTGTGKKQTEAVYNEAVRDFEKVATQLYELLKKKKN